MPVFLDFEDSDLTCFQPNASLGTSRAIHASRMPRGRGRGPAAAGGRPACGGAPKAGGRGRLAAERRGPAVRGSAAEAGKPWGGGFGRGAKWAARLLTSFFLEHTSSGIREYELIKEGPLGASDSLAPGLGSLTQNWST